MKFKYLMFFLIIMSCNTYAFNTGQDLAKAAVMYDIWKQSGKKIDGTQGSYQAVMYQFYVDGAVSALHSTRQVCLPDGKSMYETDDEVLRYIDNNIGSIKKLSGALAVTTALKNSYPCSN